MIKNYIKLKNKVDLLSLSLNNQDGNNTRL